MATTAAYVAFHDLCQTCENISTTQGSENKKKFVIRFITFWRTVSAKYFSPSQHSNPETSFYPAMRLLVPQFERDRAAYGIKEAKLAQLYIKILCLNKNSRDAQKLLNFRLPKNAKGSAGDFASVAYFILKNRFPEKGRLTIEEVNNHLDNISSENAAGNREKLERSLFHLIQNMSAMEQKWLIRMILKDMKFGMSEITILKTFHPDAKDLYDVTSNLSQVCLKLHDPSVRLHEIEVTLFSAFRPMLAHTSTPDEVEVRMHHQPFYIETKYDGERSQLHKEKNMYKYFSRNGFDFTSSFGESPLDGSFTLHIAKCFKPDVRNCILDGEMVCYSRELKCIVSKGQSSDVKYLSEKDDQHPCFYAFDVLLLNDTVLTSKPLSERLDILKTIFNPIEGRIEFGLQTNGANRSDVINALNNAIDNREEGIVVKDPNSKYIPNSRKGGWLKIKPEYVAGLMDELDLLIIGGYFGDGKRRAGIVSHFLLGLAVPPETSGEKPQVFHSFTKVGSGYSLEELYQLLIKLKDHWKVYNKQDPPSSIILASGHKEKPDLWIQPSKSFLVQVKASEIVASDKFKTGQTLRFPRVEKVRYDKEWHECMTLDDLENLKQQAAGKLSSRLLGHDDEASSPKKRRVVTRIDQPIRVAAHFRGADISGIKQISDEFEGKELCIISGPSTHSKQTLEKKVVECGGMIVQNPTPDTFCVVSDRMNLRVKNFSKGNYDIVKADWLIRSLEVRKCLPWKPFDLWSMKVSTSKRLAERFDDFGDSYTDPISVEELKALFKNMKDEDWKSKHVTSDEIMELEFKHISSDWKFGLFRNFRIYLDNLAEFGNADTKIPHHSLDVVGPQLRFYGATLSKSIEDTTTHVIVHSNDTRVARLKQLNHKQAEIGRFHLVLHTWVDDCIKRRRILKERHYLPMSQNQLSSFSETF